MGQTPTFTTTKAPYKVVLNTTAKDAEKVLPYKVAEKTVDDLENNPTKAPYKVVLNTTAKGARRERGKEQKEKRGKERKREEQKGKERKEEEEKK